MNQDSLVILLVTLAVIVGLAWAFRPTRSDEL